MAVLTDEQLSLIEQKRRQDRPSYYDSVMGERRTISEDTEAALILLPTTSKDAASRYLQSFLNRDDRSEDYSDLLDELVEKQSTNQNSAVSEMDTLFSGYNTIKKNLMGDGNDVFIVGMHPLLKSFGTALGRIKRQRDAVVYGKMHLDSAKNVVTSKLNEEQKKELRSWVPVLLSYP